MKDAWSKMGAVGASIRRRPPPLAGNARFFAALVPKLAAGFLALCAINPAALAQSEAPVGPSATIGALGAAHETPATAPSVASPAEEEVTLVPPASAATATPPAEVAAGAAASAAPAAAAAPTAAAASGAAVSTAAPAAPVAAAPTVPAGATGAAVAAPTAAGSAAPAEASAPAGGSRTFLINDGSPGSPTTSGWTRVAPDAAAGSAAATGAPAGAAAGGSAGAAAAATPTAQNAPAGAEVDVNPDETSLGTTVIPSAAEQQRLQSGIAAPAQGSQIVNYQENQQMPLNEPQLHSLQEFMNEGVNTSPLGVELQEGARRMKNGREVDGLLVVALQPGSPAERAGVEAGHRVAHDVLEGAAVAASLVFPPAVLAVPVIETIQIGENYDLIIGVDGNRVTNFMDFQDQLRDAQPGETVYLNILRSGKRLQVPVEMPNSSTAKMEP
jgi:PDZ domain